MADTRRTWAALAALYADNTAGAISPQDLRDGFKSLQPHVTSSAPDENDDETSGFDTDHAWIDTSTTPNSLYRCLDASTGAAVWAKVYPQDAGGGATAFTGLTDTPTDYTGAAGQYPRVNGAEDGLEFHQLVDGFDKMVALDETTYAGLAPDENTIYFIEADA